MEEPNRRSLLSYFWTPMVAVGCSNDGVPNAQISVSVFGASAVPDQPRLLVVLYKSNYTHDLVLAKRDFSLSLLSEDQAELIPRLGFVSGRDRHKLDGLDFELSERGNPVFHGSVGWLECSVIEQFDLGDSTAFLSEVQRNERLSEVSPMVWSKVRRKLPANVREEWDLKISRDIEQYRPLMHWIGE